MSPHKFVFMTCVASQVCFHGVCRLTSLFSWRVSPHKFVFMACVASQVCFHGVCRLTSLFSWRVSPHKFVFMACVASQVCFHGVCRLTSLFSWRVSPHKFVFMACVASQVCFHGVSPHKFVFMACVASQVCFHGVCRLTSLFVSRNGLLCVQFVFTTLNNSLLFLVPLRELSRELRVINYNFRKIVGMTNLSFKGEGASSCKTFKQATGTMIPLVYVGSI